MTIGMKKFGVVCTRIYNGWMEVEAESADEARAMVRDRLDEVDWEFGEQTADYADELNK
jgi:uncharacterized ferritin-like protein (DUF455 family)